MHACVLADSTAAEKRFTVKSTGCLLQGAAGSIGKEGTHFPQTVLQDILCCKIQVKISVSVI